MPSPSSPIPQLSVSTTFIVVGSRITASALLNTSTLPYLRNSIACISGAAAADVYASSTTDIVYKPSNTLTVSSAYLGNTKQTPTVCSTANPSTQSLSDPVVFTPGKDRAVAITMTIGIRTPTGRLLQTVIDNATNIVGSLGSAYAAKVAAILQSLSSNMGYTDPLTSANNNGVYNYSDILYQASTDGLMPPTDFVMSQIGGWANMLGEDTRISQLSSIVIKITNKILVMGAEDASVIASTLLENTPPVINQNNVAPPSNNNTAIGAVLGSLAVIGVLTASLLFLRRRNKHVKPTPLSKSKVIREYTTYEHPMLNQDGTKQSWPTNDVASLATQWRKEQSLRVVKQDEVAATIKAAEPSTLTAKIALNSLKFLQQYKSAPNLVQIASGKTSATIDDSNGRRAFTSSGTRNIPPQNRKSSSSSTEEDAKAAVTPLVQSPTSASSQKSIKLSSPRTLSDIAARYMNAIQNKEPVEDDTPPVNTIVATPSEETELSQKKKKRKSSRRVVDEVVPEQEEEKPVKKIKKSKSSQSLTNASVEEKKVKKTKKSTREFAPEQVES